MSDVDGAARFARHALPPRFCNYDRLLHALKARDLDGIVATTALNVYYLTAFNGVAHKSDEPRPYSVIISRHQPDHPILVIAEYYLASFLTQPTWVEDVRPFRGVMLPIDRPPEKNEIERFIPDDASDVEWIGHARKHYAFSQAEAMRKALKDLKLDKGRMAFDDMGAGFRLDVEGMTVADGYDPLMFARAVKTDTEIRLLERSTALNETAIKRTMAAWDKGATWRDLNKAYAKSVADLGGFVRDPGGMVWGHPRGVDPTLMLSNCLEEEEVTSGTHVMFDCHGTLDLYCWDGGKTWVVDGEPEAGAKTFSEATGKVASMLIDEMKPGVRISELQTKGRDIYRKEGVPDPGLALVFFHGLGLSHMDVEITTADGQSNADWMLEENMMAPVHLLYPGGEHERIWLEDVIHVTKDGGRPLFSWGFDPLIR
ncbi:MAG: M24 family metallopeptidase [Geminicoccaceae bacterium]